jgi:hypothetical protein
VCLACMPYHDHHTSEKLATWLKELLGAEWAILHLLLCIVTDSAKNMVAMVKYLPSYVKQRDCTIHVLQLAINVIISLLINFKISVFCRTRF